MVIRIGAKVASTDREHARIVLQRGFATQGQVTRCLHELREGLDAGTLLQQLQDRHFITAEHVRVVKSATPQEETLQDDVSLGKKLVEQGLVSPDQMRECFGLIQEAKRRGDGNVPRLAQILLSKGYVTEQEMSGLAAGPAAPPEPEDLLLLDDPPPARSSPWKVDDLMIPEGKLAPPAPKPAPAASPVRRPAAAVPTKAPPAGPTPKKAAGIPPPTSAPRGLPMVKCVFCALEIRDAQPRQTCPSCEGTYHDDCWDKAGGCVREDCRVAGVSGGRVLAASEYSLYYELKPLLLKVVVGLAVVGAGVGLYFHMARDAEYYYNLGKATGIKAGSGTGDRVWRAADLHRGQLSIEEGTAGGLGNVEKQIRLEEQISCFKKAVAKKPDYVEAWFELGGCYFELKKNKEAVESLKRVLDLRPTHHETMLLLGTTADRMDDLTEAERWYKKCLEAKPDLLDAHVLLGFLYDDRCQGRKEDAATEYRVVLVAKPDDADVAGRLAQILIDQKKYVEALSIIEKVSTLAPDSVELKLKRATLFFAQKVWDKALEYAEQVVAVNEQAYDAQRFQTLSLHHIGRDQEAYYSAKKLCALFQYEDVLQLAGELAIRYGEPDNGISFLLNAYQLTRKPELLARVGDTLLLLDRSDEAKNRFEELRSLNSAWPGVNFKIALAAAAASDKVKAQAAVRESIARSPGEADLKALAARLMRETGDAQGALAEIKSILAADGSSWYAHFQYGISLREGGNPIAALQELRAAQTLQPDPEIKYEMGLTYAALKKDAAARDMMKAYAERVPFGKRHDRARALAETGEVESSEPDPFTWPMQALADQVPRYANQSFQSTLPWQYVSAGASGVSALFAVLARDPEKAQIGVSEFQGAVARLAQQSYSGTRQDLVDQDLDRTLNEWLTTWQRMSEAVATIARRRDESKTRTELIDRIVEDIRQRSDAAPVNESRVAAQAQGTCALLSLLVAMVSDSESTREQLQRIENQRKVQADFCTNALQSTCCEVYIAVKQVDLLFSVQDRRKLYEDKQRAILRRFDQRELKAKTVMVQLRNGLTALCELLLLLASDPTMRP